MKTVLILALLALTSLHVSAQTPAPAPTGASTQLPAQPSDLPSTEWKPLRAWAGDIRLRTRNIKLSTNADPRLFEALRVRLGYRADIEENLTGIIRFATAFSPIVANQGLGDQNAPGMQRRNFGLDHGYLEYRPLEGLQLWGGKTPVPFYSPARVQLVFDADLNFEGASAKYARSFGDLATFANLGSSIVEEAYGPPTTFSGGDAPDFSLIGAQLGAAYKAFGTWTVDLNSYVWNNAQGRTPSQIAGNTFGSTAIAQAQGNTLDANGNIASKFNLVGASLDWQKTWGDFTSELFYLGTRNLEANRGAAAYETGFVLKYAKWIFSYANSLREADSQLADFSDSDTNGGGTDTCGHRANLTWQTSKNFAITLTQYLGRRAISSSAPVDFQETQFDLMGSF